MASYNIELISALGLQNASVTLIGPSHGPGVRAIVRFSAMMDRRRSKLVRIASYLRGVSTALVHGVRSDLVIWHFPHLLPADIVALRLLRLFSISTVIVGHDPVPMAKRPAPRLTGAFFRSASAVFVHGPSAARDLARYRIDEGRILIGRHPDFRTSSVPGLGDPAESLGLEAEPDTRWAVVIGNLKPEKGLDELLELWPTVANELSDWQLLVAGSPQRNPSLIRRLETTRAVTPVVRRLSEEEEGAAYRLADVVLTPYVRGYSSGVIATAHSYGRPVVSSDAGDLRCQLTPTDQCLPLPWTPGELSRALQSAPAGMYNPDPQPLWVENARRILSTLSLSRRANQAPLTVE